MPPRIIAVPDNPSRKGEGASAPTDWVCSRRGHFMQGVDGVHPRWTGMLLMAELSVGHVSFGEPQWMIRWEPTGDEWVMPLRKVWRLMWPCRRCKAWFARPAAHRAHHDLADRIRVARLMEA